MPGNCRVSEADYFGLLNFHSSSLLAEITAWLDDPAGLPLVLPGEHGFGREYCLKAVCYNRKLYNLPWTVIPVDWVQQSCPEPRRLIEWLAARREINKEKIDRLEQLAESFNLPKGPALGPNLIFTILLNLSNIKNFSAGCLPNTRFRLSACRNRIPFPSFVVCWRLSCPSIISSSISAMLICLIPG